MADTSKTILDRLPNPVVLVDAGRVVVYANDAALDALAPDMAGKDLSLSIRHPGVLAAVDAVIGGAAEQSAEVSLPVPVPRTFALHVTAAEAGDDAQGFDAPARAVLVLSDITDVKRAEQMRADFVANASHELRSPLTALLGFIETLKGPASKDAEARDRFLGVMHREANRMARLIDDLLTLSRVEINEHVRPTGSVALRPVLDNVKEALTPRADERRSRITVHGARSLPPVKGDKDQLTQVFHNLVENALKYGDPSSTVRITAKKVKRIPDFGREGVAVAVADQGPGIPAEAIPRLTERFYRVDQARAQDASKTLSSTGLGLAIVKHIVSRHRGRLQVESTLGKGSTFTVFLPI